MNYFLWISNLGVVPLFLSAAFLFLPIFLSLFFLIVLVCCVFDAMLTTPAKSAQFNLIKTLYVYSSKPVVKSLVKIIIILCFAKTPLKLYASQVQTYFLSKGEQKEINLPSLQKFSIGNKEVLGHKYLKLRKVLRVKGSGVGFSDLHLWLKDGSHQKYHFYVLSKREFLKNVQVADYLKASGLETQIEGDIIKVKGMLENQSQYRTLHQVIKSIPTLKFQFDIELAKKLKDSLVAKIYKELIGSGVTNIRCETQDIKIICFYSQHQKIQAIEKYLKEQTFAEFIHIPHEDEYKNFNIQLNVIAVSYSRKNSKNLGLHQIDSFVSNIVEDRIKRAFGKNKIEFKDITIHVSTLAKPQAMTVIGKELTLSLGEQRQFIQTLSDNVQSTEWKFAGLKLKFKIERIGDKLFASYENEFTTPGNGKIEGSKEKGHYLLQLGKSQKVFKIGLSSHYKQESSLPYLASIPIFGNLFQATDREDQFQEIYGHITVSKQ